jgi:fatty-acyl-CoA synthase
MIGYQLSINAARFASRRAVTFGARRTSYAVLNERTCRLANGFVKAGCHRGDRIAVLLHNCDRFFEVLFAAAKIGAIFVPINFRLKAREIAGLLEACTPNFLLVGIGFDEVLAELSDSPALPARIIRADETAEEEPDEYETWLYEHSPAEPQVIVAGDEPLMLLHSSGTTGLPKGAIFTHATTLASSATKIIDFGLGPEDKTVVFGPLFHAGPLMDLALPLVLRGGSVVVGASRNFDPETLTRTIAAEGGTVIPVYPTMLRAMLEVDLQRFDLHKLRLIITGGEAIANSVLLDIQSKLPWVGIINNYGSTEGGPITTFLTSDKKQEKPGSVGRTAFSVDVRIADDDANELPAGSVGEVLVRSPFVCRGYWRRPELTAAALKKGWWCTGDLGKSDQEGYIWIVGRKKDVIRSAGENIYPVEIEEVIRELEGVADVAVVGAPDAHWGETVAAFVVRQPGGLIEETTIVSHCQQQLAGFKKPRVVRFVPSLPRTTVNKISKAALRKLLVEEQSAREPQTRPYREV